jgi:ankyrin repeat protein
MQTTENLEEQFTIACQKNDLGKLKELLEINKDLAKCEYYSKRGALQLARSIAATQLLIDSGADVSHTDKTGRTAIHWQVIVARKLTVKLLLENGGSEIVNEQDIDGNTALHYASIYNRVGIVKILINNGADPAIKNVEGKTAVDYATTPKMKSGLNRHSCSTPSNRVENPEISRISSSQMNK